MLEGCKLIIDNQEHTASERKVLKTADRDSEVTDSEEKQEEGKEPSEAGSKKANETADKNLKSLVESGSKKTKKIQSEA
ncbi:hypothetical protein JTB14_019576 [Gonioctena quinquepunctata]|nr:hypothetical protein JTB14_019576 [Gonioctena quinquepunctata]